MQFVAELEYFHSLPRSGQASAAPDGSQRALPNDTLTRSYREFDVLRCVIGTKLEVYYPEVVNDTRISVAWNIFAELLIDFYKRNFHTKDDYVRFEVRLHKELCNLTDDEKTEAAAIAKERAQVVDERWEELVQLLLAEKARLIRTVLRTRMSPAPPPMPNRTRHLREHGASVARRIHLDSAAARVDGEGGQHPGGPGPR